LLLPSLALKVEPAPRELELSAALLDGFRTFARGPSSSPEATK